MTDGKSFMPLETRAAPAAPLDAMPLYRQVKARLVARIAQGLVRPGAALPSETELAAELGVSQGTVRKALDEMTAERLLVRRQGRGTFVAEHDERRILFQFFRLAPDGGEAVFPTSRVLDAREDRATEEEREALGLPRRAVVARISRVRLLGGEPAVAERIALPAASFPGLLDSPIPNNLYGVFASKFGVTIGRAGERIKAVAAPVEAAEQLGVEPGSPLLRIERTARDIENRLVEWRVSLCRSDRFHYAAEPS